MGKSYAVMRRPRHHFSSHGPAGAKGACHPGGALLARSPLRGSAARLMPHACRGLHEIDIDLSSCPSVCSTDGMGGSVAGLRYVET